MAPSPESQAGPSTAPAPSTSTDTYSVDNGFKEFYEWDSVYRFDVERNLVDVGSVRKTYADVHYGTSSAPLKEGQISVAWTSNATEVCEQNKVHLMSRYIYPGMIVRRLKNGKESQKGLCKEMKQVATVQICGTDILVENVDQSKLRNRFPFGAGEPVVMGEKVGRIKSVYETVTICSVDNKSKGTIRTDINANLYRWSASRRFFFCVPKNLRDAVWEFKSESLLETDTDQQFRVESCEPCTVNVYWLLPGSGGRVEYDQVKGDDLAKLKVLHNRTGLTKGGFHRMELGEKKDDLIRISQWTKQKLDQLKNRNDPKRAKLEVKRVQMEHIPKSILNSKSALVQVHWVETTIIVLWQDGTEELNIPSTELYRCESVDTHEFYPGWWVMPVYTPNTNVAVNSTSWGVVKRIEFSERIAEVQWSAHVFGCVCQICQESKNFNSTASSHSVYDLLKHRWFSFNVNVPVHKMTADGATLGLVTDILPQNGCIVVKWLDGSTEDCLPGRQELTLLLRLFTLETRFKGQTSSTSTSTNTTEVSNVTPKVGEHSRKQEQPVPAYLDSLIYENEGFCIMDEAPETHQFYSKKLETSTMGKFTMTLRREYKLLQEDLPAGVWVRAYENRTDLLSVMIRGPNNTPYEDGLFLFDIQLSADYPIKSPQAHYISYADERLNPNLYVDGTVCVSLLGTWPGQKTETWNADSNLLQVIVSIQALILVAEPHYNEPGLEKQTQTQTGQENSRNYNESVVLNVLKSMIRLLNNCPVQFKSAVRCHFMKNGEKMCRRLESYCSGKPFDTDYPLLPVSKGLKLALEAPIITFRRALAEFCGPSGSNQGSSC